MMIIITGTPGVGKSSVSEYLKDKLVDDTFISINSLLEDYDLNLGVDEVRGYKIVDVESMIPIVDKIKHENNENNLFFEGHLTQDYPGADIVIILRCDPMILKDRLDARGWTDKKVHENVSAEILGICSQESYDTYGDIIQEIDTTDMTISEVGEEIIDIINGKTKYGFGDVDFLSKYFTYLD